MHRIRTAEREAFDCWCRVIGVKSEVHQAIEDGVEADPQLEPGEVHTEALVFSVPKARWFWVGRSRSKASGREKCVSSWLAEPLNTAMAVPAGMGQPLSSVARVATRTSWVTDVSHRRLLNGRRQQRTVG